MPQPTPFPIRIEDLTADFLEVGLGRPVTHFKATRIGADRGMLGEIFRLELNDTGAADVVVAKFAALREGSLASARRGRNHERELRCYEELLGDTPVRAPGLYGAWYDEATAHFLLLQQAVDADTSVDQIAGLSPARAERVIDQMAALHARWWGNGPLQQLDWLPGLDSPARLGNLETLTTIGWAPLIEMLGGDAPDIGPSFGQALPSRLRAALIAAANAGEPTLLHCDLRADNLLFDRTSGDVTLVDWQGCGVGPAAFDLAYFIVQSLTVEDRRAHEAELCARWVDGLRSRGVECDDPLAGYSDSLWYGMAIACALPVISDPEEPRVRPLAQAVATRTLAALADHHQLEDLQ